MIRPFKLDLYANRWGPYAQTFIVEGVDLSDASFDAQVRLTFDTTGTPLVDLGMAEAGVEGISVTVDATGDDPISTITMLIDEQVWPAATERGDDATFYWDMQVDRPAHVAAVWWRGKFIVQGGVTQ